MWTRKSRGRIARIERKTKRYPSDLTDEEWERIAPLMPKPERRGRPREVDFREVINAVRYLVRSGGSWRMLVASIGPSREPPDNVSREVSRTDDEIDVRKFLAVDREGKLQAFAFFDPI